MILFLHYWINFLKLSYLETWRNQTWSIVSTRYFFIKRIETCSSFEEKISSKVISSKTLLRRFWNIVFSNVLVSSPSGVRWEILPYLGERRKLCTIFYRPRTQTEFEIFENKKTHSNFCRIYDAGFHALFFFANSFLSPSRISITCETSPCWKKYN